MKRGIKLAEISYLEAKELLNDKERVVMLPCGGGTKAHGPHLPLGTDQYVIEWMADRITERAPVLTLPNLSYAYFPAFVDWAGSVTLSPNTFMNCVKEIFISYIRFGIRKFFILDGGITSHAPLVIVSSELANDYGARVAVSSWFGLGQEMEEKCCEQLKGGHADETETSCMLYIQPNLVQMNKCVEEYCSSVEGAHVNGIKKLHISAKMETPHGVCGNSKLATREKGRSVLEAKVNDIVYFLEHF